jgi:hypothetical protein
VRDSYFSTIGRIARVDDSQGALLLDGLGWLDSASRSQATVVG